MAQIGETIFFGQFLFRVPDGAGNVDQDDMGAFFANQMVVVFMRIAKLIVTAGTLEIHLVDQMKFFHEQNHSKYRGIVGLGAGKLEGAVLDFLQRHWFLGGKQAFENATSVFCDTQPFLAKGLSDTVDGEMRNHIRSILTTVSISNRNTLTGEMGLRFAYSEFPKVKNTCGEDRIGETRLENIGEMLEFARPTAGNDRYFYGA